MEVNNGRIDDSLLVRLYRDKITSKPALNQGYYFSNILGPTLLGNQGHQTGQTWQKNLGVVVDGFPKTYDQAKTLYGAGEDEDGEPSGDPLDSDPLTVPELVIDLTATEEFLKQRMMNLPEEIVQGTSKHL